VLEEVLRLVLLQPPQLGLAVADPVEDLCEPVDRVVRLVGQVAQSLAALQRRQVPGPHDVVTAEQAEQDARSAATEAREALEAAGEAAKSGAEVAGRELGEAADKAEDAAGRAAESAGDAAQRAGERLESESDEAQREMQQNE